MAPKKLGPFNIRLSLLGELLPQRDSSPSSKDRYIRCRHSLGTTGTSYLIAIMLIKGWRDKPTTLNRTSIDVCGFSGFIGKSVLKSLIQHFHKFVEVLEERDVDVSKVKISKAEAALWGYVRLVRANVRD